MQESEDEKTVLGLECNKVGHKDFKEAGKKERKREREKEREKTIWGIVIKEYTLYISGKFLNQGISSFIQISVPWTLIEHHIYKKLSPSLKNGVSP